MGIVMDIIIIAIFALSVYMGYRKGLIGVVFSLFAFVITVVLTWILYTPVTNLIIEKTELDENIESFIIEKGITDDAETGETNNTDKTSSTGNVTNSTSKSDSTDKTNNTGNVASSTEKVSSTDKTSSTGEYIEKYVSKTVNDKKNEVVASSAHIIAQKAVAIIVLIGLFLVIRVALILLKFVAEGIASLPIIKQFDKSGGILYGVLRGAFVIYLVLAILFFIMSVNNIEFIADLIDKSILSKFLYNNNIILNIIFHK